jgi:hypothetical protein
MEFERFLGPVSSCGGIKVARINKERCTSDSAAGAKKAEKRLNYSRKTSIGPGLSVSWGICPKKGPKSAKKKLGLLYRQVGRVEMEQNPQKPRLDLQRTPPGSHIPAFAGFAAKRPTFRRFATSSAASALRNVRRARYFFLQQGLQRKNATRARRQHHQLIKKVYQHHLLGT